MSTVVLSHNRYTLLDRSAVPRFAAARKRGMGVINAASYGSGMLANALWEELDAL